MGDREREGWWVERERLLEREREPEREAEWRVRGRGRVESGGESGREEGWRASGVRRQTRERNKGKEWETREEAGE